jgi:hypothetical protein
MKSAYSIVWGQCTEAKLEARDDHEQNTIDGNVISLLKNIKDEAFGFQSQKYKMHALHNAKV